MLILFDHNTPAPLRPHLVGHAVRTAAEMGWASLSNGHLLDTAERNGFDMVLTCDRNMPQQQTLADRKIAILILSNSAWPVVREHIPSILQAVERAASGRYEELVIPYPPRATR